jgi:hypothetical protein
MSASVLKCPLCGAENACGMANGGETCWCFDVQIAPATLERIPPGARGVACICKACAARSSDAAPAEKSDGPQAE